MNNNILPLDKGLIRVAAVSNTINGRHQISFTAKGNELINGKAKYAFFVQCNARANMTTTIIDNRFLQNQYDQGAIVISSYNTMINNNIFADNISVSPFELVVQLFDPREHINAINNWWSTTNETDIKKRILMVDITGRAIVDYIPYLIITTVPQSSTNYTLTSRAQSDATIRPLTLLRLSAWHKAQLVLIFSHNL